MVDDKCAALLKLNCLELKHAQAKMLIGLDRYIGLALAIVSTLAIGESPLN